MVRLNRKTRVAEESVQSAWKRLPDDEYDFLYIMSRHKRRRQDGYYYYGKITELKLRLYRSLLRKCRISSTL